MNDNEQAELEMQTEMEQRQMYHDREKQIEKHLHKQIKQLDERITTQGKLIQNLLKRETEMRDIIRELNNTIRQHKVGPNEPFHPSGYKW